MSRTSLALLVLFTGTAFAPAPFPRSGPRDRTDELSLRTFQGTWRVVSMGTIAGDGKTDPYVWNVTHVRVTKDRWAFLAGDQDVSNNYTERRVGIDPTKKPIHFNYFSPGDAPDRPSGVGLIRKQGRRVEIVYQWASESDRGRSFDALPVGHWLMVLER